MTFNAIVEADILQDAFEPVAALVGECKVHTTGDGLAVTAVDPANVAMVDMTLEASACASYQPHSGDRPLGVDLERLLDVVGMADSGDMIQLELDAESRKLHIDIGGLSFTMGLLDPESIRAEPDLPDDLPLVGTYVFEGGELGRAVTAADLVSDHIAIVGESEELLGFDAEGDTDDVQVTLGDDDLLSGRFDGDEAVRSLFSLEYLKNMHAPIGADTDVSLLVGEEMPTKIKYSLHDGDVSVTNMLAPRIDSGGA